MNTPEEAAPCESNSRIRLQDVVTMGIVVENPALVLNASVPGSNALSADIAKRIVPKSKYVRAQRRRASMGGAGLCMLLLAFAILSVAVSIGWSRYDVYKISFAEGSGFFNTRERPSRVASVGGGYTPADITLLQRVEFQFDLTKKGEWWAESVCLLALFTGAICVCVRCGVACFQQIDAIDPGVPLTRANAGHLPVQESLVRAACEPAQESLVRASMRPETGHEELLRPVRYSREAHEEQLVRPAK